MFEAKKLTGLFPPLVTPFRGSEVDVDGLAANVGRYEQHDTSGYVIFGSTGEAPLVSFAEKVRTWNAARGAISRDKLMIAGTGLESTEATAEMCQAASDAGADAALVLTPFFFGAQMDDEALLTHFVAVAEDSPIPVILYSVPKFTNITMSAELVVSLAAHDNIVGFKDSSGDLSLLGAIVDEVPEDFCVLSGHAGTFNDALATGAVGGVLAASNVLLEPFLAIERNVRLERNREAALMQRRLESAIGAAVMSGGVPGIKRGVELRGLTAGAPRAPLREAPDELTSLLDRILDELVTSEILPHKTL